MTKSSERVPLARFPQYSDEERLQRARAFREQIEKRRTVRDFSDRPVPRAVIDECLRAAGSAPSGANLQPWHFTVVTDPALKRRIRLAAEEQERHFYEHRASDEWLEALRPLGTDDNKPYLETAPCLIAIFSQPYHREPDGTKIKHYYPAESVGIATGFLIAALHDAGLATLTHTPSPMGFLTKLLERPAYERAFLLLVVGFPADDASVPAIERKPLGDFVTYR
jgi:nitroreductase